MLKTRKSKCLTANYKWIGIFYQDIMNRFCLTPELTLLYTSLPQDIYMIDITQDITLTKKIGTIILITLGNFLKENTAKHAQNIAKQSTSASNIKDVPS